MAKQKRKRAAWKWVLGSLLVLIGGGWGVLKVAEVMASRDVETQASKLRKLGYPTTVEEFIHKLPKDESQNAAPLYLQAIAEFERIGEPKEVFTDAKGVLDKEARTKFVRETDGVYQILVQASQKKHCAFPRDWSRGMEVLFPEYASMRTFGRICAARAEVAAEASDWRLALDNLMVGMRIAKHCEEPSLISHLVALSIDAIQMRTFEGLVGQFRRNPQFLGEARQWLEQLPPVADRQRAYDFEIVGARMSFEQMADPKNNWAEENNLGGFEDWAMVVMIKTPAARRRIEATYLERMHDALAQPFENSWKDVARWEEFDAKMMGDTSMLGRAVSVLAPVFQQASQAFARGEDRRRVSVVAVWVAEQRLQLGTLPHQLPDQERFRDPWTGERYVYIKRGEGYTIRSVGPNKVDDGGSMVSGRRTDDTEVLIPREQ